MSRWLEESLAAIRAATEGPQIFVASSMGGSRPARRSRLEAGRDSGAPRGMVLIAPAVDFTEALMWAKAPPKARRAIEKEGVWRRPSAYSDEPYLITRALIEDGRRHLLLGQTVRSFCPVRILRACATRTCPTGTRSR